MSGPVIYVRGERGAFVASTPVLPGAVASGATRDEAIANARRAFRAYRELLETRGVSVEHWKDLDPDTFVAEDLPASGLMPEDQAPLEEHEIRDFLHIFEAQHAALIALVERIPHAEMDRRPDDSTWSVREALEHIMTGSLSILSKLERWPDDAFASLQASHRIAFQRFTVMEPSETRRAWSVLGRPQTVRRVMRRLVEHEYEHYRHIEKIVAALGRRPPA